MEVDREGILERGLGALFGQATGDALGTTVEFSSAGEIKRRFPDGLRKMLGGGPFGVKPGQITDDTELALALARSLAERGSFDADAVALRYVAWYRSGPFDVGGTTRRAFGAPPDPSRPAAAQLEERANGTSEANGSLMRVSPLGVFGWSLEPGLLAGMAAQDSRLSHPNPVCQAACAVFTHAIAFAVRTGAPAKEVFEEALAFARSSSLAAPVVDSLELARQDAPGDFMRHQGWVRIALQNAFFQLLHAASFEAGVVDTVMRGGDTDTNGCIAGALLGSVHGAGAEPLAWREAVLGCRSARPSDYWCADLPQLAERLCFPDAHERSQAKGGHIVAVADLHGHLSLFEKILAAADAALGEDYVLVTLGDYADNGPEVRALLDRLVALRRERGSRFVPIMGNHDLACARLLGWQGAPPSPAWWMTCQNNYWGWSPRGTGPVYGARSAAELAERMPKEHQAFLQQLPWFYETDDYVFVHAGLKDEPLRPQLERLARKELPDNPLWTNAQLRDKSLATVSSPAWGKTVVSGHTKRPGERIGRHPNAPHFADRWRITLSSECDVDGPLYAVVLPERRVLVAEREGPARIVSTLR
jgi:ADP-ribosylglycohydrolase